MGAGIALDKQHAAGHQTSGLRTDIADDANRAALQRLGDAVEAVAAAFEHDLVRILASHFEQIADASAPAREPYAQGGDSLAVKSGQAMRGKHRKVQPLLGLGAQREG